MTSGATPFCFLHSATPFYLRLRQLRLGQPGPLRLRHHSTCTYDTILHSATPFCYRPPCLILQRTGTDDAPSLLACMHAPFNRISTHYVQYIPCVNSQDMSKYTQCNIHNDNMCQRSGHATCGTNVSKFKRKTSREALACRAHLPPKLNRVCFSCTPFILHVFC